MPQGNVDEEVQLLTGSAGYLPHPQALMMGMRGCHEQATKERSNAHTHTTEYIPPELGSIRY